MLIALHKPFGVLSQFTTDAPGQRTLTEFELPKGVYSIGRLDADTEGLLLITDNNRLKTRLLDPQSKTPKVYWAQVEGTPTDDQLKQLRRGVTIRVNKRDHKTSPAEVNTMRLPKLSERDPPVRFRKTVPTTWLELSITEGKNRQVRRMCAAVGLPVLRLVRVKFGDYELGKLARGTWSKLA